MSGRFEQSTRQHTQKFRRRIRRDIKRFATDYLFSLFGTIFPIRASVLDFELFLDRRFHVVVTVRVVFGRHSSRIEFPGCGDVIAPATVVVGIFDVRDAVGIDLHRLSAGGITLDQYVVATLPSRNLRDCAERDRQLNE